jgi:hypothetical protein
MLMKQEISGKIAHTLKTLKGTPANEFQKVAAAFIELLTAYYEEVLGQSRRSFVWALVAAGVGLLFFLGAAAFILIADLGQAAVVSLIGGALVEVIAGINFHLYEKASEQLSEFHGRLDQTGKFMLANSVCEALNVGNLLRGETRSELAKIIARHK